MPVFKSRRRLTAASATTRRYGGPTAAEVLAANSRMRTAALSGGAGVRRGRSRSRSASVSARRVRPRTLTRQARGSSMRKNVKMTRKMTRRKTYLRPSLNIPYSIERLQGVNNELPTRNPDDPAPSYPGFYQIGQGDPVPAGSTDTPLYMVDLTVLNQQGFVAATNCAVRRMRVSDTGGIEWANQNGQLPNLNPSGNYVWQNEDRVQIDSQILYPRAQHDWYDIRLKLYGARRQAVKYQVSLVRFMKREYCPEEGAVGNSTEDNQNKAFWQSMVKPLVSNSILPGKTRPRSFAVRILKTATFNIAASTSDDLEAVPENVDVRWFVRDGRVLNYREGSNNQVSDQNVFNAGWATNDAGLGFGQITTRPPYWSRTYLMIRATDMTRPVSLDDMDDTPSFDMCVRRKTHYYN